MLMSSPNNECLSRRRLFGRFAGLCAFVIGLALWPAQSDAAGITLIQAVGRDAGQTTTSSLAFTSPNTAGNWIAVVIRAGNSRSQVFTVSDSNGNTYRSAFQLGITANPITVAIFYAENVKSGANTITVSDTVSGPFRLAILEYSGLATTNSLDAVATSQGTSTSPNSGNAITTVGGDLLLGEVVTNGPASFSPGPSYTTEVSVPAEPNTKLIVEDQIQAVAGSAAASATLAVSDNWGAGLAAFKAAGGGGSTGPASITATAGTPQSATINTAFTTALQATVKDSSNNPVSGATVTFTAPVGGASGTFAGGVNTATTNAQGVATAAAFTANSTAGGPYNVTASVTGVSTPANFSMTNLAGAAASVTATAGTPQSAGVNSAFATALQATVRDSGNNAVSGVTVTFTAPASGASGTFAGGVNSAITNAQGVATAATFTANGTAGGPYNVTASVSGVSTPANFSLTNLAAVPASITATAGTPQSATISTAFATALQATVKDGSNNPVSGVTVTFAAPTSGASGTFTGGVNTATTNAQGIATAAVFTANSTAGGPYNVTASVTGVSTPANFSLTNLVGAAASITASAGTPQSATINAAFATALQATVNDSGNNPVSGVTVTFTAPTSGASGTFAGGVNTATTNAQGIATATVFTANNTAGGPYNVTASAAGVATAVNYSLTNLAPGAAIALVQHRSLDAGQTASASLSFASANAAGNWIAVAIRAGNSSSQVFSVRDTNGNTYRRAFQIGVTANPITVAIFYAENIIGGVNTITVSDTVSGPLRFAILEYSGVATSNSLDVTAAAQGTSTSPNSGNASPSGNGDLLLGSAVTNSPAVFTAGANYLVEESVPAEPGTKLIVEDQVQAIAALVSASASIGTSDNWAAGLAAFRPAGGTVGGNGPASITATAGTPQSATINTAFATALQATVKDGSNNPVSGVTVTFTAPTSGASGAFAGGVITATTNAQGVATAATFTANSTAGGPYNVTASVSGVSAPANFSLTNLAAVPASITATAGTPQNATINSAFATALQATVKDSGNNPVGGVTVTFTAPASGASGTFAGGVNTATTNAQGVATAATFTANSTAGGPYNVTASVAGVATPANYSLTNLAPPPPNIASLSTNSGAPGALITVTGTNFGSTQGTSTITFNGTSGSPTNWNSTTITVPVPVGATSGNIVVTVGGAASNGVSFTVLPVAAGISLVQHTSVDAGTTTSAQLGFRSNTTSGNWIAVCIRGGASGEAYSVTDSLGNTYQQAVQFNLSVTGVTIGIFYAENIKGGANTITVRDTISAPLRFAILEYSGVAASNSLDGTVAGQGNSGFPNSGNLNTTSNGDLLLGAIISMNPASFTAGTNYTVEESVPGEPGTKLIAEDQIQRNAGPISSSATLAAADNWGAALATFRSASGAAQPLSVSVSPTTASVATGFGTQNFTATLISDFQRQGVTWALSGAGCSGNACGILSNITPTSVTYTGPAQVPSPATVTLTATAVADSTKTASATITVTQGALNVAITPKRAAIPMSQTLQFNVTVTNDPQNLGATLSVQGNNGGTSTTGTITPSGLYTAGTQPGLYTITATSNANASVSASATIAVTDLSGVLTHHYDVARTGQNLNEYGLTTSTVSSSTFGMLFSCPVDGFVYAAPLWVPNLNVGGQIRNVVIIVTEHDSVFVFDADSPSCNQIWTTSFLSNGVTSVPDADTGDTSGDMAPEIGITSTPAIDLSTNTVYVEAMTKDTANSPCSTTSPCYFHRLHALDLLSGAEKFNGPVAITAPNFVSLFHKQRPGLLLANGVVHIAFGSHGDKNIWQGWLMGYNATTLTQTYVWSSTVPTGGNNRGAIWGGGAGPALDASGNIYVETGNGQFDGGKNLADSVVKLSPTGTMLDYFTPFDQLTMQQNDIDLGSAGSIVLPDSVGSTAHPHLLLSTGKIGILYLLDQNNMGKFNSGSNQDVAEVTDVLNTNNFDGGIFGDPAYWNGNVYVVEVSGALRQYQVSNATFSPLVAASTNTFPPRGATPVVSSSGITNGILWILDLTAWPQNGPAILDAYDATNVSNRLYSSPASGAGAAGPAVKFTVPTVANGKVYIGGQNTFTVFGLLPN